MCQHFCSIIFCLQLVCRMFKHKLLKAVAVLQLIERVLVLRVLFPPISPKNLSFIDNILFYLISSTFFWPRASRSEEFANLFVFCLGFSHLLLVKFFFFHVKGKKKFIAEFGFLKEQLNLKFAVMIFFSLLYCTSWWVSSSHTAKKNCSLSKNEEIEWQKQIK